jgi:hypothetical protein
MTTPDSRLGEPDGEVWRLPGIEPDPVRAQRTRLRCRQRLVRRARHARIDMFRPTSRPFDRIAIGTLWVACAAYVTGLMEVVLRLLRPVG